MNPDPTVAFLLERGGPAIRYRALAELCEGVPPDELAQAARELHESPLAQRWLARLRPDDRFNALHGADPAAFENVIGKLAQLGCRAGMPALDAGTAFFRDWLAQAREAGWSWRPFLQRLVGGLLAAAGYEDDPAVGAYLRRRLAILADFCRRGDYDIYVDRSDYKGIPAGFKDTPLVNPALYPDGDILLPMIHDMHGLAHYPDALRDGATQAQINAVVDYVLDPRYQALRDGYGLMQAGPRRYYALGWSVHLHGYQGMKTLSERPYLFVQRVALMAHFPTARAHRWLAESLAHLESFCTPRGTYLFPRVYLPERTSGYWVAGAYMGFEENRRSNLALELESTFWMALIKRLGACN
jgi:hypothetical protein